MAKITVKAKINGGVHLKYGEILEGQEYTIDEEDFGAELFERPNGFESPHEKTDRERAEAVNASAIEAFPTAGEIKSAPLPKASKKQEGGE